MMKTYEVIDVCNGFELIRIIDVGTGGILDHAVAVPLANRGPFRLVKLLDSSFGTVLEYLILTVDGTPVDTFSANQPEAAYLTFLRHGRPLFGLRPVPAHSSAALAQLVSRAHG